MNDAGLLDILATGIILFIFLSHFNENIYGKEVGT